MRCNLRADNLDSLVAGDVRANVLDPFKPYLHERLVAGDGNTTVLLGGITEQGNTGAYNTLRRYLLPLRRIEATTLTALSPFLDVRRCVESPGGSPVYRLDSADEATARDPWALSRTGRRREACRRVRRG